MDDDHSTPSPMSSTLRDQHAELTKRIVLEATRRLIAETDPDDFSMQRVAKEAGVAYRTVYRYFPNRQALLDEFSEWIEHEFPDHDAPPPDRGLEHLGEDIRYLFDRFDRFSEYYEAVARLGGGILRPASQAERTAKLREEFATLFPDLDPDNTRKAFAVFRLLVSSQAWFSLRDQFDFKDGESGDAVAWAIELLVEGILAGKLPESSDWADGQASKEAG
jgi:AcrR family transcriptional regulator